MSTAYGVNGMTARVVRIEGPKKNATNASVVPYSIRPNFGGAENAEKGIQKRTKPKYPRNMIQVERNPWQIAPGPIHQQVDASRAALLEQSIML